MSGRSFGDRAWWADLVRVAFGRGFWGFLALAAGSALACFLVLGPAAFEAALARQVALVADIVPRIVTALLVAGLLWVMLPRQRVAALLGRNAGVRGLLIAMLAGVVTPGGPTSAFALLAVLGSAGAGRGVLVTYITAWAMLGVQRFVVWDMPIMGLDFSLTRFLVSLPLPLVAGLIAARLPLTLRLVDTDDGRAARERRA